MDLEGSDGRERGEDDTSFERQSALFALAVADVLLINMWAKDVGRETGAGKPLLKTIFQVFVAQCGCRRYCLLYGSKYELVHRTYSFKFLAYELPFEVGRVAAAEISGYASAGEPEAVHAGPGAAAHSTAVRVQGPDQDAHGAAGGDVGVRPGAHLGGHHQATGVRGQPGGGLLRGAAPGREAGRWYT